MNFKLRNLSRQGIQRIANRQAIWDAWAGGEMMIKQWAQEPTRARENSSTSQTDETTKRIRPAMPANAVLVFNFWAKRI